MYISATFLEWVNSRWHIHKCASRTDDMDELRMCIFCQGSSKSRWHGISGKQSPLIACHLPFVVFGVSLGVHVGPPRLHMWHYTIKNQKADDVGIVARSHEHTTQEKHTKKEWKHTKKGKHSWKWCFLSCLLVFLHLVISHCIRQGVPTLRGKMQT